MVCDRYIKAVNTTDVSAMSKTISDIQQLITDAELTGQLRLVINRLL